MVLQFGVSLAPGLDYLVRGSSLSMRRICLRQKSYRALPTTPSWDWVCWRHARLLWLTIEWCCC